MEQIIYERPRERLRSKGVQALATPELIQVVLGSGGPAISIGKLARSVAQLLSKKGTAGYGELLALPGIGDAKACQLLAAIELGRRSVNTAAPGSVQHHGKVLGELAKARRPSIMYVTFNGQHGILKARTVKRHPSEHYSLTAKRIISDVLSDGSASFIVGMGHLAQVPAETMDDLNLAKALAESASIINVRLEAFMLVGKSGERELKLPKAVRGDSGVLL